MRFVVEVPPDADARVKMCRSKQREAPNNIRRSWANGRREGVEELVLGKIVLQSFVTFPYERYNTSNILRV